MIDPKHIAETDQHREAMVEIFPPLLWAFFKALMDQGFTDAQALTFTQTYFLRLLMPQPSTNG